MEHENELPELVQQMTPEERATIDEIINDSDPSMVILKALRTYTLEGLISGSMQLRRKQDGRPKC